MNMALHQSSKLVLLLLSFYLVVLNFSFISVHALNIGIQASSDLSLSKECSRKCESEFCQVAPFLRYGKYCGLLYSGCPGEKPCDGIDSCCMKHDACIQSKNKGHCCPSKGQHLLSPAVTGRSGHFPMIGNVHFVELDDYLSTECNQDFLNCIATFKGSGGKTFKGSTCSVGEVTKVMTVVIHAALLAGRYLHKP